MTQQKKQSVLIVDDDPINITIVRELLRSEYATRAATNGETAVQIASAENPPDLILLDIFMPGMDGYRVCGMLKESPRTREIPIIFLSSKNETDDIVRGFQCGVVDYVTKPFRAEELRARVRTHLELRRAKLELEEALADVKKLSGLLPICSNCKKIRDDKGYWQQVEEFVGEHSEATFSHGLCPDCVRKLYPDIAGELLEKKRT